MTRLWVVVAFAFLAAACGSGDGDVLPVPEGDGTTSTTADTTTSSETATEPADSTDDTEATGIDLSEAETAVIETWTTLLDAAASGAPTPEQLETIAALSDDDTTEQLADFFPEAPAREIAYHPALTEQDGIIAIDDCIIMNRGFSTGFSNWLLGQAEADPDSPTGYTITNIQLLNLDPCVPTSIAEAAIDAYEAHWDAFEQFFTPPDPDSQLLQDLTTGEQLVLYQQLAADFQADDRTARGRPTTAPEFLSIESPTELTIFDCQEADPEFGVYEQDGLRTDLIPQIAEGQLDIGEAVMVLEDGSWKMSLLSSSIDVECRTPPLQQTLQVVGG